MQDRISPARQTIHRVMSVATVALRNHFYLGSSPFATEVVWRRTTLKRARGGLMHRNK